MIITGYDGQLPRPATELAALALYYDTRDTSAEMEGGERLERIERAVNCERCRATSA